jgi:hypothetical protein
MPELQKQEVVGRAESRECGDDEEELVEAIGDEPGSAAAASCGRAPSHHRANEPTTIISE